MPSPSNQAAQAELPVNGVPIPPLRNGDHLDRFEFERRYDAMPEINKAELIEGVVYMLSPVSFKKHALQSTRLLGYLFIYSLQTPGTQPADNATVRLDLDNEPQPDALMLIEPSRGGRTIFTDGYVTGGPELVAEVAASSVSIDRNAKMNAYRRNGVCEYILWRVEDNAIDWFVLRDGQYVPLMPDASGVIRSEVFPGLWLDVVGLLAEDLPRVQAVLQKGCASPEHLAFVARLNTASA